MHDLHRPTETGKQKAAPVCTCLQPNVHTGICICWSTRDEQLQVLDHAQPLASHFTRKQHAYGRNAVRLSWVTKMHALSAGKDELNGLYNHIQALPIRDTLCVVRVLWCLTVWMEHFGLELDHRRFVGVLL